MRRGAKSVRLLLARHGMTAWNDQRRFQGQTDVPLNDAGKQQALALSTRLAREDIHTIYASDLRRAWQTAQEIKVQNHCPLVPEPRLRELRFGEWEGLTYKKIQVRDPQALLAWQNETLSYAPPGGESLTQLTARVAAALEDIHDAHPQETVLLVAHAGALQVLLCQVLGLSPDMYWQFRLEPASLSEVRLYPQGATINFLNDTCHLEALKWDN